MSLLAICPECDQPLVRCSRRRTLNYRGHTFEYDQPGEYCDDCDEAYFSHEDLQATIAQRQAFKSHIDSLNH